MKKIKAGIIGATGYAGAELVRLLVNHPMAEVAAVSSVSFEGQKFSEVYPNFSGICDIILENACRVLSEEYPEINWRPEAPDEKARRVGQSVAAATLPEVK